MGELNSDFQFEALEGAWKIVAYKGADTNVVAPSEIDGLPVTHIGNHAFEDCHQLEGVSLPETIVFMGDFAFADCHALKEITIPSSLTALRFNVFRNCRSLEKVNLPDTLDLIGDFSFYGCSSLEALDIPQSVTKIGENAFCGCSSLSAIDIPPLVTSLARSVFYACDSLRSVRVTSNLNEVLTHCFESCPNLESVTIVGDSLEDTLSAFRNFNFSYLVTDYVIERGLCPFEEALEQLVPNKPANHRRVRDPHIVSEERRNADKELIAQRRLLYACRVIASYPERVEELNIKKKLDCLLCLSRFGRLEELRVFEDKHGFFTQSNLSKCIDAASKAGQTETAAYLMEQLALLGSVSSSSLEL